jgi:tRNA(fMet)-specific endonuclease VapC
VYLIDTNIAIHLRDDLPAVLKKAQMHVGNMAMSALTLAELQQGLYAAPALWSFRKPRLDLILAAIPLLPFGERAATAFGVILGQVGWARTRAFDRMIAAHAIATSRILVTANVADFDDIPGLQIEDWTDGSG